MIHYATIPTGARLQLHPATDHWMRGDRYGVLVSSRIRRSGAVELLVRLDRSGRTVRLPLHDILEVVI